MPVLIRSININNINNAQAQSSFGPYQPASITELASLFGGVGEAHTDFNVTSPNVIINVGTATNTTLCLIPWASNGMLGRDQFAQCRQVANTGTAANPTRPALFTFCRGLSSTFDNLLISFYLRWRVDAPSFEILTSTAYNPQAHVVIASAALAPANGDLVRLEARKNGANVDLLGQINGTTELSVSSALLPPDDQGLPGWGVGGTWTGGGVLVSLTDLEFGVL